jgi:hypothetical protein
MTSWRTFAVAGCGRGVWLALFLRDVHASAGLTVYEPFGLELNHGEANYCLAHLDLLGRGRDALRSYGRRFSRPRPPNPACGSSPHRALHVIRWSAD